MKIKQIVAAILITALFLCMMPVTAFAVWGEGNTLDNALSKLDVNFDSTKKLDWLYLTGLGPVEQRYTYFLYKDATGNIYERPVFCIDPTKGGAYEIVTNIGPDANGDNVATYIRGEKVADTRYMQILYSGYPHMTLQSLGLQTIEEGYYSTKVALWMYVRGNDPTKLTINPVYSSSDPVALRVHQAAIKIYTDSATFPVREPRLTLTGTPAAVALLDSSGQYYIQGVEVWASGWIGDNPAASGDVQLEWESSPPSGTIVLGTDGEDITSSLAVKMNAVEGQGRFGNITIKYPASAVDDKFSPPTLKASALLPNNDVYVAYAEAGKDKYQRYLVEGSPKITVESSFVSQIIPYEETPEGSGLRIRKLQAGTNIPLAGAVYEVLDPDGKMIFSGATPTNGIIDIPLAVFGNYTVTETTPPQYHLLPNVRTQSVTVSYGRYAEVTFTNDPYGTLRVAKRDATNGRPLSGAAIQIRNITTNATQEGRTDSSGNVVFEKLPVGAYEIVEVASPDGYALDSSVHTVNVLPLSEGETSYTLTNKANPGLRIIKFDRQTMMPIDGITFEVWHDGELYGTYVTDAWGEIELHDLPAGTYTVREVATREPYVPDPTAQWVELKAGQGYITELVFLNLVKPGMYLIKLDSVTMKPLVNAVFLISQVGGSYAKEFTTDINGEIDLSALEPGAYEVLELQAPDGYLIDSSQRLIQLNAGENAQFVFTNTRKPVLEVLKFDGTNYLPGAIFRIAKIEDGAHYLDRITDTNGSIHIEDLEPGIYSVQEISTPPGYVLNDSEYHVELFPGRTSQLVVNNVKKPDLCIIKTDANTGQPIAGVTYTVHKVDSATVSTVKTDANGEAWLYELDPGVYQVTEQSVPAGYLLDPIPQLITLEGGRVGVVRFQNDPRPRLRILKVDVVTGKPLPNAEFRVSKVEGNTVSEYITDESGSIIIDNLDAAIYEVTEFMPPNGYIRYDETKQIQLEPGKTKTLKFDNIRKPVLIFLKTNAATGGGIPGATYKVEYETSGGGVKTIGSFKTGADGRIIIPQVEPGWYMLTETLPAPGFSLPTNPVTRMYVEAGQNAYLSEFEYYYSGIVEQESGIPQPVDPDVPAGTAEQIDEHSGSEYYTQGEGFNWPLNSIVIKKTHAVTGELLAGAAFELYRPDEQVSGVPGTNIGRYTTDNSGVVVITGLEPGYYVVKEVQAPPNFLISENSQQNGYLKADGATVLEFTFANLPYGSLLISKIDAQSGQPLAGARFKVTESGGTVVGSANGEYTTDSQGKILIPNLKPGAYVVTETQAPPNYVLDTIPQTIQVGTDGKTYTLEFSNAPLGGATIIKLDEDTRQAISGVEFELRRMNGEVIGTYRTDNSGGIYLPQLDDGWYLLTETKAARGYLLNTEPYRFEVKNGKTNQITITNKKTSSLLIEKTDSISGKGIYGVTFILYDEGQNPIMQLVTDQDGNAFVDRELTAGKYYLRELEPAEGYEPDTQLKTIYIEAGKTTRVAWKNKPIQAQIQVLKYSSDHNTVTALAAGSSLKGAVFEITRARSGVVVGYITTDARGVAASEPLPLGRYYLTEVTSPPFYQLSGERYEAELEYAGQIVRISAYNKSANLGTTIKKTGNMEVMAGDSMRYDFSNIANTSNVPLSDFYWYDRIPTDAARAQNFSTGTYNQRLYYRVLYKTNYTDYRVLASNLLTTNNYSFNLTSAALGLMSGEYTTEVKLEFGTVEAAFASVTKPMMTVLTLATLPNGYQITNRCEVGGQYLGAWQTAKAAWITTVVRYGNHPATPTLPKTGY